MPEHNADTQLSNANQQIAALEQQLEHLREQQEVLLYTLSHDLRTPVMTILGFTDMLIADLPQVGDDPSARQYLEHIRNSANRQANLIENLLNLSRLSRQTMNPATVDLTRLAFDYWQGQPQRVDNKRIACRLLATPPVQGDAQLLTIVMQALLDNAVKFSSKVVKPEITFGAEEHQGEFSFYIRDNGVGFNAERAERLFQPFRRLHSSKDYDGLGMGLATSALIVQRHGGRIWLNSAIDQGTTVHFTIGSA